MSDAAADPPIVGGAAKSVTVNTVAQAGPTLFGYLASFVSAPIVLGSLGLKAFGIWALTGALAQYAGLLDFGVGPTLARFVALYEVRGEDDRIGEVLGVGLVTAATIIVSLVAVSILAANPLARAVDLTSGAEMRLLLLCATAIFAVSTLNNVLTAFHVGVQEMVGPNVALTAGVLLNLGLSIAAALSSHSLARYAVANAVASLLSLLVVTAFYWRSARGRVKLRWPRIVTVREVLSFSVKNQALTASTLVNFQTDKIVIAIFIGPAAAGGYELANRAAAAARSVGVLAVGAMLPSMTAASVELPAESLIELYVRWTARSAALGVPPLLFAAAMARLVLHTWLGHVPANAPLVLAMLSLGYVINTTTAVGYSLAYAKGDPGIPARAAFWTATGNIISTVALAPIFGIFGVLAGTALAFTAGSLYQVWLVHRKYEVPLPRYVDAIRPVLILACSLSASLVAVDVATVGASRLAQTAVLLVSIAVFILAYAFGASRLGLLPASLDRALSWRLVGQEKAKS